MLKTISVILPKFRGIGIVNCRASLSTNASVSDLDPGPTFLKKDVQNILWELTQPDYKKVFRRKRDGRKLETPIFKFMTDEQLAEARKKAHQKLRQLLHMPPVVKVKPEVNQVLCKNKEIQGLLNAKLVFTDITYGIKEEDRFMVVREPDGTLRMARNDERKRLSQIYYDYPGRTIEPPKMFHGEYLESLLERGEYSFILDRACLQYDPNEQEWHRVTSAVYEHANSAKRFENLRSTRHFGPMVFYLVWNNLMDNLFHEYMKNGDVQLAVKLVQLYHIIHPDCKSASMESNKANDVEYLLNYVRNDSPNRGKLELAVQTYKEIENEKKKLEENVRIAHGAE